MFTLLCSIIILVCSIRINLGKVLKKNKGENFYIIGFVIGVIGFIISLIVLSMK
jgi:hypothetical protein